MNDDLNKSLERLHDKQDAQTEKLTSLEISISKQQFALEAYMKQSDRMAEELGKMNDNMSIYNAELKVHIAGVIELKEQNRLMREDIKLRSADVESRLIVVEKPIGWFKAAGNGLKWAAPILAAVVTAVLGILKLMGRI